MNKIYYYTGSGNSLAIARKIAEKIGNCDLVRVSSKLDISAHIEADKLGFVFPVYAWGMPVLFREFVRSLMLKKAGYVFVVADYAGSCGNALGVFNKIFRKKGIRIDAFGEVLMPSNYVIMGNASPEQAAISILQKAEPIIEELAQNVFKQKQLKMNNVSFKGKLLSSLIYPLFALNIHKSDKAFFVTDKCNGCGICARICPIDNIILNEKKQPFWQHHCEQCHACLHWCPQRAIEFSAKTSAKNRYTHPQVKVSELC